MLTVSFSVAKLTDELLTPSTFCAAFSTLFAHAEQVIPSILKV